jgi:hypothetical protein
MILEQFDRINEVLETLLTKTWKNGFLFLKIGSLSVPLLDCTTFCLQQKAIIIFLLHLEKMDWIGGVEVSITHPHTVSISHPHFQ